MKELNKNKNKINIAIIDSSVYCTGARNSILQYIENISDNFSFFLITPYLDEKPAISNLTIIYFNYKNLHKNIFSILLYPFHLITEVFRLNQLAKRNNITIFHFNDLHYLHGILLKILGYKIIYHVRLLPSSYIGKPYKFYISITKLISDKTLVVSQFLKDYYNHDKAILVYDRIKFHEYLPRYKVNSNQNILRVLVVGNYVPGKGHEHAIHSLIAAKTIGVKASIDFYGNDLSIERMKYKNHLKKVAESLDFARFHSSFTNKEEIYKNYDILLNLSESESFSLVNLEAMYYGLPTISANSEGPSEQIINNITGFLVDYEDYQGIAEILLQLEQSSKIRIEISHRAKTHVRKLFSTKKYINILKNIYSKL